MKRQLSTIGVALLALTSVTAEPPSHPLDPRVQDRLTHPLDPRVIDRQTVVPAEFRPLSQLVTTRISRSASVEQSQPAYLGLVLQQQQGRLLVECIEPKSPAAQAGLQEGDILVSLDGAPVSGIEQFGNLIRSRSPGDVVTLHVQRGSTETVARATLTATSRPLTLAQAVNRVTIGVRTVEAPEGARVETVQSSSPAERSGLKPGDVILRADGNPVTSPAGVTEILSRKREGESVVLVVKRGAHELTLSVPVTVTNIPPQGGWDARMATLFKKPVYRLAVVPIRFPDVAPNPQVTLHDWEEALFSRGTYIQKSPTGQVVYGSLNDYYLEQSYGKFSVQGKVFDWIAVHKKRLEYANDSNRFALLAEALDKLRSRDGADALNSFDGLFFIYAGERVPTNRGGLYWPHRSTMLYQGRRINYFICPEGGRRMDSISVIAHEFGHMLGLPDLYARPESPGSEGLGVWCTMSVGHGRDGKPLHFSAWCKEQMGWLEPVIVDPTVRQKVVLGPVQSSPRECLKILIRPDGSEYLLLENRVKRSFDRDLPAEGLLIWRIVDNRPVLEESHGISGPEGPTRFLGSVPYPSGSNNAYTPFTTPSSRSLKGGGLPVYITNINRLPDGRVTFYLGYEFN